jgi:thioredoxin-related protein
MSISSPVQFPVSAGCDDRNLKGKQVTRRAVAGLACAVLIGQRAWARDSALPSPASLIDAARAAIAKREPFVVLVSLLGCPYCEMVRRNYLAPMRTEGLSAWQIDVTDRQHAIVDFSGERSNGEALAGKWKADLTPTVLFFDARGTEIAPRIVGVASVDFYGRFLDEAISMARKSIGS